MNRISIALIVGFFINYHAYTQSGEFWATLQTNVRFTNRWSLATDLNHRWLVGSYWKSSLSAVRAGAVYHTNNKAQIAAGYAWFGAHLDTDQKSLIQEHRLWQQYLIPTMGKKTSYFHRIRLEQRFRQSDYNGQIRSNFSVRLRYMFNFSFPVYEQHQRRQHGIWWVAANEIMLHTGNGINRQYFDQNRLISGPEWRMASGHSLFLLYQFTTRDRLAGSGVSNFHIARLTSVIQLGGKKQELR